MPILKWSTKNVASAIEGHYRRFFGAERIDVVPYRPGDIATRLPDLRIARIRPKRQGANWLYLSIGAWRADGLGHDATEFIVVSPEDDARLMFRLGLIAYYHAGPSENRLRHGDTLSVGEPWVEDSPLTALLISLPYPWGPELEWCQAGNHSIRVLWALPIHEAERSYRLEHGLDALETLFDEHGLDYANPARQSVVPDRGPES